VRHPLSAAMTAPIFVSSAIGDEKTSLADLETRKSIQDDMGIIETGLKFIGQLDPDLSRGLGSGKLTREAGAAFREVPGGLGLDESGH
jgi:hypothetical protein